VIARQWWQSEFLQLVSQAVGLALFFFWGSSQSKEGNERIEAKSTGCSPGLRPGQPRRQSSSVRCEPAIGPICSIPPSTAQDAPVT
jgi:hypothetical protein